MDQPSTVQNDYLESALTQDTSYSRSSPEKITETLAVGLLFITSFFANGVIFTVLSQSNRRQTVTNIFLFSLVISNFLISVLVLPFVISSVFADEWVFGHSWCEGTGLLLNCLSTASNACIAAIAMHRFYIVVKPLALKIDLQRANCIVGLLWFWGLTCAVPPLFGWNCYVYSVSKAGCTLWWNSGGAALIYTIFYIILTFFVPLIVILLVYRAIYKKAKQQRMLESYVFNGVNGHMTQENQSEQSRMCSCISSCAPSRTNYPSSYYSASSRSTLRQVSRHSTVIQQRTFQSVSAILVSFVVCQSPYYIYNTWVSLRRPTSIEPITDFIITWLYLCMTAVNPITYGYSNRQIRRAVKRLPVLRSLFRQGRDRTHHLDPNVVFRLPRRSGLRTSQSNDGLESSGRS